MEIEMLNVGAQNNRFSPGTARGSKSNSSEYLKALSRHITPEVWDLIVARAVQDATVGKPQQRAKAREWLVKHGLPFKSGMELHRQPRMDYDLLVRVYRLFEEGINDQSEIESALAATFGTLLPHERATLRSAILAADSEEIQSFWVDARQMIGKRE